MKDFAKPAGGTAPKHRIVLDALVGMIAARGIEVGDRLPSETQLAAEIGVGRSTVREAMKAWQGMGIVTRNKGAGTVLVAPIAARALHIPLSIALEAESLSRMLQVRRPLEIAAARAAAEHATERQRHEVMGRLFALLDVFEAGEDWRSADHAFHAAIHDATGNPLFGQLVLQLQSAFNQVYEAPFGQPQLGSATIPLHRPLAEAVRDGDADAAARATQAIMARVMDETRAYLDGSDD